MRQRVVALTLLAACGGTQTPEAAHATETNAEQRKQRGDAGARSVPRSASEARTAKTTERESEQVPLTPDEAVERVRAALESLRSSRMGEARDAAAEALRTMADGLSVLPGADSSEGQGAVAEMRFQAERLSRTDFTFDGARWSKQGLSAALSGLAAVAPGARDGELASWFASARRAVDAVDTRSITFQRAEVQDAFRTVSAVFALTVERLSRSAAERTAPVSGP